MLPLLGLAALGGDVRVRANFGLVLFANEILFLLLFFLLLFDLALAAGASLELPHTAPEALGKLGDTLRPKEQQNYNEGYE